MCIRDRANDLELLIKENLGENDAQAIRDAVTNFVDQGCTIIVGCSFGYGEVLNELANSGEDVYKRQVETDR